MTEIMYREVYVQRIQQLFFIRDWSQLDVRDSISTKDSLLHCVVVSVIVSYACYACTCFAVLFDMRHIHSLWHGSIGTTIQVKGDSILYR